MSLPILASLALLFVVAHAEVVSSVTPVTETYIPHASYPYSDVFGTGPINAYRESPGGSYDDPPSTSLVSNFTFNFLLNSASLQTTKI